MEDGLEGEPGDKMGDWLSEPDEEWWWTYCAGGNGNGEKWMGLGDLEEVESIGPWFPVSPALWMTLFSKSIRVIASFKQSNLYH